MRTSHLTVAAWCWLAAGVVYVGSEAVAASAFPGYSYAANYISDLGIPDVEVSGGRAIDSPLHLVMNTGFVLHGVLFAAAALLAAGALGGRRWFATFALVHGVGIVLVGLVHSGTAHAGSPFGALHGIGAGMAIIGGNLTTITAALAVRRAAPRLGATFLALGLLGLASLVGLLVGAGLADGTWERLSVYTVTAFELLLGAAILARRSGLAWVGDDDRSTLT